MKFSALHRKACATGIVVLALVAALVAALSQRAGA